MKRLLVSIWLLACGSPQHGTPPPADAAPAHAAFDQHTAEQVAEGMLEMLQTMVGVVEKRKGDCDAMAADLEKVYQVAQPLFDVTASIQGDEDAIRLLEAALDARASEASPLRDRLADGLLACKDNAKVVDAVNRMPHL